MPKRTVRRRRFEQYWRAYNDELRKSLAAYEHLSEVVPQFLSACQSVEVIEAKNGVIFLCNPGNSFSISFRRSGRKIGTLFEELTKSGDFGMRYPDMDDNDDLHLDIGSALDLTGPAGDTSQMWPFWRMVVVKGREIGKLTKDAAEEEARENTKSFVKAKLN